MLQNYCGKWALLAVSCALWHLKHISCFLQKHSGSVSHWFQRRYIHSISHCPKQMRSSYSKLKHAKQHIAHILTQPEARTVFFWILNCQECRKLHVFNFNVPKVTLLMQNRNTFLKKGLGETHFLPLHLQGWIRFTAAFALILLKCVANTTFRNVHTISHHVAFILTPMLCLKVVFCPLWVRVSV